MLKGSQRKFSSHTSELQTNVQGQSCHHHPHHHHHHHHHHQVMLSCAQPCHCVLRQPVANLQSRSAATHLPTFTHRQRCGSDRANPALLRTWRFCCDFFREIELSCALATVSFAFCQPHRPKALHSFRRFLNEIELSLQSRAPFADLVSKVVRTHQIFFNIFKWKSCSPYTHVRFLSATSTAQTKTLLRRPRQPSYRKKRRVCAR